MAPIPYEAKPGISNATLICGWTFGAVALIFLVLSVYTRHKQQILRLGDFLTIAATVVSIALTIQTNWAVADEGEGHHVEDESPTEVAMIAKVLCLIA